jgi:hypothetical protein
VALGVHYGHFITQKRDRLIRQICLEKLWMNVLGWDMRSWILQNFEGLVIFLNGPLKLHRSATPNTFQFSFLVTAILSLSSYFFLVSETSASCARCTRMSASMTVLLFRHWQISPLSSLAAILKHPQRTFEIGQCNIFYQ